MQEAPPGPDLGPLPMLFGHAFNAQIAAIQDATATSFVDCFTENQLYSNDMWIVCQTILTRKFKDIPDQGLITAHIIRKRIDRDIQTSLSESHQNTDPQDINMQYQQRLILHRMSDFWNLYMNAQLEYLQRVDKALKNDPNIAFKAWFPFDATGAILENLAEMLKYSGQDELQITNKIPPLRDIIIGLLFTTLKSHSAVQAISILHKFTKNSIPSLEKSIVQLLIKQMEKQDLPEKRFTHICNRLCQILKNRKRELEDKGQEKNKSEKSPDQQSYQIYKLVLDFVRQMFQKQREYMKASKIGPLYEVIKESFIIIFEMKSKTEIQSILQLCVVIMLQSIDIIYNRIGCDLLSQFLDSLSRNVSQKPEQPGQSLQGLFRQLIYSTCLETKNARIHSSFLNDSTDEIKQIKQIEQYRKQVYQTLIKYNSFYQKAQERSFATMHEGNKNTTIFIGWFTEKIMGIIESDLKTKSGYQVRLEMALSMMDNMSDLILSQQSNTDIHGCLKLLDRESRRNIISQYMRHTRQVLSLFKKITPILKKVEVSQVIFDIFQKNWTNEKVRKDFQLLEMFITEVPNIKNKRLYQLISKEFKYCCQSYGSYDLIPSLMKMALHAIAKSNINKRQSIQMVNELLSNFKGVRARRGYDEIISRVTKQINFFYVNMPKEIQQKFRECYQDFIYTNFEIVHEKISQGQTKIRVKQFVQAYQSFIIQSRIQLIKNCNPIDNPQQNSEEKSNEIFKSFFCVFELIQNLQVEESASNPHQIFIKFLNSILSLFPQQLMVGQIAQKIKVCTTSFTDYFQEVIGFKGYDQIQCKDQKIISLFLDYRKVLIKNRKKRLFDDNNHQMHYSSILHYLQKNPNTQIRPKIYSFIEICIQASNFNKNNIISDTTVTLLKDAPNITGIQNKWGEMMQIVIKKGVENRINVNEQSFLKQVFASHQLVYPIFIPDLSKYIATSLFQKKQFFQRAIELLQQFIQKDFTNKKIQRVTALKKLNSETTAMTSAKAKSNPQGKAREDTKSKKEIKNDKMGRKKKEKGGEKKAKAKEEKERNEKKKKEEDEEEEEVDMEVNEEGEEDEDEYGDADRDGDNEMNEN